jgi:hypothetical protein
MTEDKSIARGQLSPQGSEHGDLPRRAPVEPYALRPCPFCGDTDMDLIGLKWHLFNRCRVFVATRSPYEDCD